MTFSRTKITTNAGARRRAASDKRIVVSAPRGTTPTHARAPSATGVDMCSSIFEVCKRAQSEHLDALGATCMFDVDGGRAPPWVIDAVRAVIEMLIADIARTAEKLSGAAVGVTLRQSGGFWALAIAENLSGTKGAARAARRLAMVRALTDRIECICRALPNPSGSTIAIAFPVAERTTAISTGRLLH